MPAMKFFSWKILIHRSLRVLPWLLLLTALACGMPNVPTPTPTNPEPTSSPTLPPPPTATPRPLPPTLVQVDPPLGAEMPLQKPVTLYFNQAMDRASVEAAIIKQIAQDTTISWTDDATVSFVPKISLSPDQQVNLQIGDQALSAGGMAMNQPISLTYRTTGYLRLVQSLPEQNATDVDPTSAIIASFNRPVVTLGADQATLSPAFAIEPAAKGRGEWLNTSTYVFYPQPPLDGGKVYTVRINRALTSVDGGPLDTNPDAGGTLDWSFITAAPKLVTLVPEPGSENVRLDARIVLTFNQPMDPASVQSYFGLQTVSGPVTGKFEWSSDDSVVTFTPDHLLERNTVYTMNLDAQARARGGTPLVEALNTSFYTVSTLAISSSEPAQGGGLQMPYGSLVLNFSAPVPEKDILNYISFDPPVKIENHWWETPGRTLRLSGGLTPSSNYSLRVSADLADVWGGKMGQDYLLNFRTQPLDSSLLLTSSNDVNFLTPQDTGFMVQVTNLSKVSVEASSISLDEMFPLFGPNSYETGKSFRPANAKSWEQPLSIPADQPTPVEIALTPDRSPLSPGIYWMKFNMGEVSFYQGPYLFAVSNIQVMMKLSATEALIWAIDLRTDAPLQNAPVTLYTSDGIPVANGQTDAQGLLKVTLQPRKDYYTNVFAVIGQPGEDNFALGLSTWDQGISGYYLGINVDYSPPTTKGYLYTDRPIYRPGQTVYFRAVVRQAYNGRYTLPEIGSMPLAIYDGEGKTLTTLDLPLSTYGTAHGEFTLPAEAKPGYYQISVPAPKGGTPPVEASLGFQVAEYRKPEINLQVSFAENQAQGVLEGETLNAHVNARYFFDAPVSNVGVHWALYSTSASFSLPGYKVGLEDTRWMDAFYYPMFLDPLGSLVKEGDAKTAPDGTLILELPSVREMEPGETSQKSERRRFTVEVTVKDESGLPVSARASVEVNPASFYIGLRPDSWVARAGEQAGYDVQVVGWDQKPAGVKSLRAEFQKVVWERTDPKFQPEAVSPEFTPKYTPIASTDFTTNEQGQARLAFTPPEPGTYQINIFGAQPADSKVRTEALVWVGGKGDAVWPNLPNSRVRLTADREAYQPGDTAQVFVPNPFKNAALAMVTVERGVVMRQQVITLEPGGSNLSFPLTAEDAPNVYVSAVLLGKSEQGIADFRVGMVNLPVKPSEQTLNVALAGQPERAGPGDEVTFDVQVTDAAGKPVVGEFSLSVVDLAALALADPNAPDIVPAFYNNQPLGVRTGLSLAAYSRRKVYMPGGLGGGGGELIASVVRERFPDTAYWNAEVITDLDGKAQVKLALPDTLTTWQVDTRGLTQDMRVGQAKTQIVTTKDLLVRPVTPRFLVLGDHAMLAAIVQNNTAQELPVKVSLQATGFNLDDPNMTGQEATIPAGGRARVEWWGNVQDVNRIEPIFYARAEASTGGAAALEDAARPAQGTLPVRRYFTPQTFSTAGIMDQPGELLEAISLPRTFDPRGGDLSVELAPSLAAGLMDALDVLEYYPYACTEQTLSRFLPNLELYRTMQQFNLQSPDVKERLDRTLNQGLSGLLARQNTDGGWSWWQSGKSDPFVSAYVLFGLARAGESGVIVNSDALQRAIDYLSQVPFDQNNLVNLDTPDLDRNVFIQFALSQAGVGNSQAANALYEYHERLSPWAQALLSLTLEKIQPGIPGAASLVSNLQSSAIRSASGVHWESDSAGYLNMVTTLSNSAMVVYALAQRDPASPLVADAVRYLMANRQGDGAWNSTYSTAWTLMAITQVMKGSGEMAGDFTFNASLNGTPLANGQAGGAGQFTPVKAQVPVSSLYPTAPNALLLQRQPGAGRLYYRASLSVAQPVEQIAPLAKGINLARQYIGLDDTCPGGQCVFLQGAKVGDRVKARLSITLPHDAYYLVVEDYIPAGTEILDTSLKTSQIGEPAGAGVETLQATSLPYEPRRPFTKGWGWWYFSDPQIYDDHIAWAADYLSAGSYELTYTLVILQPGQYKVLPGRAWQFYFPEVQGSSAGGVFNITP